MPIRWHAWIHTFDHVWRLQPPWVLYKTQFSLLDSTCLMSTSTSLINKNVKTYRTTAFFLPKHGKTIRFFSFLHVFFFIPNPQASSLAEGHTPHVEQGPADGEQRQSQDLATGNHHHLCHLSWENFVVSRCLRYLIFFWDFICVYAWLCANPLWPSALWIFRFIQQDHHPSSDGEKLKQQSMKPPISRGSNQCLPVFVGPQPPMF